MDKPISQLPIATTLTGVELIPIVQNGITKQAQTSQLANVVSPGKLISSAGIYGSNILFNYSDGTTSTAGPVVATVAIGTTTTLPAGSSATVTNSGSSANGIFNFGIPVGATGAGVAVGGTTGQILSKASNTDYDTTWKAFTGTGSVVLSNSPTLTGNVSANVNLRADTLNNLLSLAGGTSEIGYATDANALVRFNGTAGQAQMFGVYGTGSTLNFNLTDASYAANTAANPIDCRYISYLNIIVDNNNISTSISNLYIKLPLTTIVQTLDVNFGYAPIFGSGVKLTFGLSYQPEDIASSNNTYFALANDPTTPNTAGIYPNSGSANQNNLNVRFCVASAQLFGWTRLPQPGEGYWLGSPTTGYVGNQITGPHYSTALTSGVVTNIGYINLQPGTWMINSMVYWTVAVGTVASELNYSLLANSITTLNSTDNFVRTEINGALGTVLAYSVPPYIVSTQFVIRTISATSIITTAGGFSCLSNTGLVPGAIVQISGTLTGTGSISGYTGVTKQYTVLSITGTAGTATGFVLRELNSGIPITTTIGTTTGLSFSILTQVIYGNTRATIVSGSVTGNCVIRALRIA